MFWSNPEPLVVDSGLSVQLVRFRLVIEPGATTQSERHELRARVNTDYGGCYHMAV